MRKGKNKSKNCPFIDEPCKEDGCMIFNETLNRCEISLVVYNLYKLSEIMKLKIDQDEQ